MRGGQKKHTSPVLLDYPVFNLSLQVGLKKSHPQAETEKPE
jgi:hypothetical protein